MIHREGATVGQLAFRRRSIEPVEVLLRARGYGNLHLDIRQTCEAEEQPDGWFIPRTVRYRYAIRHDDELEPALRWDYVKAFDQGNPCRHHLQGTQMLRIGGKDFDLNANHLPTGYVTLEEIIRFCIVDLHVKPLNDDWHELLERSYGLFKTKFDTRGPGATKT